MKYLSWREVYEMANVNQSTSSFQRQKFLKFYNFTGEGRNRKYEEGSVDVLVLTSTMYNKGNTYEEIVEVLEGKYGVQIINELEAQHNSSTTQQVSFEDTIRKVFQEELTKRDNIILELKESILEVKEAILKVENGNNEARSALNRDKEVMELIRSSQLEAQRRKWWRWGR